MNPWTIDADNIDFSKVSMEQIYDYVVPTPAVKEFLSYGHEDKKLFVVAPKGLGKTLLLKAKSYIYRKQASGYHCIPTGRELVEKLTSINVSFSKEKLNSFKDRSTWEKTWELSLYTMLLRHFGGELPSEILSVIGDASSLFNILSIFLMERSAIEKLYPFVPKHLSPRVSELDHRGTNQIAIFIDNIDEGVEQHAGYKLKENTKGTVSEEVWLNAQLGLMHVARNICATNKHIRIFSSIRSEAVNCDISSTSHQFSDLCTFLHYSKEQIKEIFEHKINMTPVENLVKPTSSNPIECFVGFSKVPHKFAMDNLHKPRLEDTFDFIYRHTFGSPRDIVSIGSKIFSIPVIERTETAVREEVNSVSNKLLSEYKKHIIPYFQDEVFDTFCELARRNVISREERDEITNTIIERHQFNDVFPYLYSLGLIGTIEFDLGKKRDIQRFLPVGQYSFLNKQLPEASKYVVIHSSIDQTLKDEHGHNFYDENNIIGNGYEFFTPATFKNQEKTKSVHAHFGLTRDSLSLIIPEICKNKIIAVIQFPHRETYQLLQAEEFILETTSYPLIKFKVINHTRTSAQIQQLIQEWKNGINLLVYSDDSELIGYLLKECKTITVEGDNKLPDYALDKIEYISEKKVIYLCQRIIKRNVLESIKNQVQNKNLDDTISVETSLVDRLSYKTSISLNETYNTSNSRKVKTLTYKVEAEKFGKIICRERNGSENKSNDVVRRTKSYEEQRFYENRQKYLVEGIYKLTKIIRREFLKKKKPRNLNKIYELFFDIQIAKLVSSESRENLMQFFSNDTETGIVSKLKEICKFHKNRFQTLKKFPEFVNGQSAYIEEAKKIDAFPNDKIFYRQAKESSLFTNNSVVRQLQNLLNIKPLTDYLSVFICFSKHDEVFAKKLSDCLKKRGVNTYFFVDDHRYGNITKNEKKEINRRDRILFIASKQSITSEECQKELTVGIEKRKRLITNPITKQEVKDIFIPIMIDDYIMNVTKEMLDEILDNSTESWRNVNVIKQFEIQDFSMWRTKKVDNDFEKKIDETIMPALNKRKRTI